MKRTLYLEIEFQDDSNLTDAEINIRSRFEPKLSEGEQSAACLLAYKMLQLIGALQ